MKTSILGLLLIGIVAGCGREEPVTYQVPKEQTPAPPMQMPMGTDADNEAVMQAHAAMMETMSQSAFEADVPEGWTEVPASGMRMAGYTIEGTSIDFYLISLTTGDIPSNVNRWRGQVELPEAAPEAIAGEVDTFEVDGHEVNYVEIYNTEGGKGIIAAIIDLTPSFWYFTAKGSVDELQAHAPEIRHFIETIKIQ